MGISFNFPDATSHADRVGEAMRKPAHLSGPVPLPPEVISAADYISSAPDAVILAGWESQLWRLNDLVRACDPMQAERDRMTPQPIMSASSGIKSVSLLHLMSQFGLGGSRRLAQFVYGFGATGAFSQDGLFPPVESVVKPAHPHRPIKYSASRFDTRAKKSGGAPDATLWREALPHVKKGVIDSPPTVDLFWRIPILMVG